MNQRNLLGEEMFKQYTQDFEEVRRWLKAGAQPREMLPVYRAFNDFYRKFL